jgi:drug/metabolite transporter (DMT)-like permease
MLVVRRTTEKSLSSKVDSLAMSWLQQLFAMPFIVAALFFAPFFAPTELSGRFWTYMGVYAVCCAIDVYCYFKAISLADISYVAPLLSLVAVGNVVGAYFVLGQKPTAWGLLGAALIVCGAFLIHKNKRHTQGQASLHRSALLLILTLVVVRSYFSNIEVFMLRETNSTTFNFYSSLATIPILLITSLFIVRFKKLQGYWKKVKHDVRSWYPLLLFIGVTYTVNMLATYQAKLISPDAGYVGAVKSAQVLPMMLVGSLLFGEKVGKIQWLACGIMLAGLVALGIN